MRYWICPGGDRWPSFEALGLGTGISRRARVCASGRPPPAGVGQPVAFAQVRTGTTTGLFKAGGTPQAAEPQSAAPVGCAPDLRHPGVDLDPPARIGLAPAVR